MSYAFPRAGALTEKIDIQQRVNGQWTDVLTGVWAELVPMTGKEFQAAESTRPAVTARWRVRYDARIAKMDTRVTRVHHGSGDYGLTYIEDVRNAHVELYLASEREDP